MGQKDTAKMIEFLLTGKNPALLVAEKFSSSTVYRWDKKLGGALNDCTMGALHGETV